MRPYNVEIFTQDFEMVGNTNVNEITYKEDYLSSDGNTVMVLALPGVKKQDYIRISRGDEEYAGIVTEIGYGTDKSKKLQTISYKPLMELLNTDVLFDVDLQGQGSMEQFICDRIKEMFITNEDEMEQYGLNYTTSADCKQIKVILYNERFLNGGGWGSSPQPTYFDEMALAGTSRVLDQKVGFNKSGAQMEVLHLRCNRRLCSRHPRT